MKLTIVAATGRIGHELVTQALAAGHDVTAVARRPRDLPAAVRAVTVDLAAADPGVLADAVAGADAVLSGLGPRSIRESGITTPGTRAIVTAMRATGVRRLVVVSAAPVSTVASAGNPNPPRHDPGEGFVTRHVLTPMVKRILTQHYADLATMEDLLRDSGLDWTVVRPPRLNDKPLSGRYRSAYGRNVRGGVSVGRADVAHLMLDLLNRPDSVGQAVGVGY
jgi:putative NADH-flavin reductase